MRDTLEYHHLAIALKHIAEMDDDILQRNDSKSSDTSHDEKNLIQSESTYRLSPQVLSQITPSELQTLLSPHLLSNLSHFPNLEQRCRLLNELGWGLRHFYSSSAT